MLLTTDSNSHSIKIQKFEVTADLSKLNELQKLFVDTFKNLTAKVLRKGLTLFQGCSADKNTNWKVWKKNPLAGSGTSAVV